MSDLIQIVAAVGLSTAIYFLVFKPMLAEKQRMRQVEAAKRIVRSKSRFHQD